MKKILTTLLLLVCGSGAFAQYMSGGLVSQGTLINNRTEIVRSGFDVWAGGGIGLGLGSFSESPNISGSYHVNVNAGYNVTPRVFIGAGIYSCNSLTNVSSLFANIRIFNSRSVNSLYGDFRLGKIVGGKVSEDITEREHDGYVYSTDIYYYKPHGIMGGWSLGYIWDRFAFEWGMDLIGAVGTGIDYSDVDWDIDWVNNEHTSIGIILDTFFKVAYRF